MKRNRRIRRSSEHMVILVWIFYVKEILCYTEHSKKKDIRAKNYQRTYVGIGSVELAQSESETWKSGNRM
jgi:hypothetical protein